MEKGKYITALKSMVSLSDQVVAHAIALADDLNESERAMAIKKLTPLNKKLALNIAKQMKSLERAEQILGKMRHEIAPGLRKVEEKVDRESDVNVANSILY